MGGGGGGRGGCHNEAVDLSKFRALNALKNHHRVLFMTILTKDRVLRGSYTRALKF